MSKNIPPRGPQPDLVPEIGSDVGQKSWFTQVARAVNFLIGRANQVSLLKDADQLIEIDKHTSPANWTGNTYASPAFVVQQLQDQPVGAGQTAPMTVLWNDIDADGPVTLPNASNGFWEGLMVVQSKKGDGSAQAFTFVGNLKEIGAVGYNEGSGFDGVYSNAGSTNGYLSGVEVLVQDSADNNVTHHKTRLHGVIGRVAKFDTTFPSADHFNSNSLMGTSEGNQAVGSLLYAYDISGHGWNVGIDMGSATIASGVAIVSPKNSALGWINSTSSAQVPIVGIDVTDNAYIRPGAAGAHIYLTDFSGNPVVDLNQSSPFLTVPRMAVKSSFAPGTPPAGQFYIYMDQADNKLKATGPSGTTTVLALP